jgi:hypothetical protein
MHKNRCDKSVPLVRLGALVDVAIEFGVWYITTKPADNMERAETVIRGSIRAKETG